MRLRARDVIIAMNKEAIPDLVSMMKSLSSNDKDVILTIFQAFAKIGDASVKPDMKEARDKFLEWKDQERGITTEFYKKLENLYNKLR